MSDLVRRGSTHFCTVNGRLGAITKLENVNGRIVARTESGVTFILPIAAVASVQPNG